MDFWIPLLGSALGGAIITSVFGLIKSRQDKGIEHARWLRNEKIETYSQYLETIRLSDLMVGQLITGVSSHQDAVDFKDHTGGFRLRLISPKAVREAAALHREKRDVLLNYVQDSPLEQSALAEYEAHSEALFQSRLSLAEVMAEDLKLTV